jgi:hypothetical protein
MVQQVRLSAEKPILEVKMAVAGVFIALGAIE